MTLTSQVHIFPVVHVLFTLTAVQ